VVYLSDVFPTEGSAVDTSSDTLCEQYSGPASVGKEIAIRCAASEQFRYVIIQSLDAAPERLCIGEVAVFARSQ